MLSNFTHDDNFTLVLFLPILSTLEYGMIVYFMGNMSKKVIKSRWITGICHLEDIQEEPPTLCVWNAAVLVLIFLIVCPNLFAR
jgi:hypothetical protein